MAGCRCPKGFCHLQAMVSEHNINLAVDYVRSRNKHKDKKPLLEQQVIQFWERWPDLKQYLMEGNYTPEYYSTGFRRSKTHQARQLDIPNFIDKVIMRAMTQILSPPLNVLLPHSVHGWREGCNQQSALQNLHTNVAQARLRDGDCYILRSDIKSAFETIEHPKVFEALKLITRCSKILMLVRRYIRTPTVDSNTGEVRSRITGVPTGSSIGPLICNAVLSTIDIEYTPTGWVRYADDICVVMGDRLCCEIILKELIQDLRLLGLHGLSLSARKTGIYHYNDPGFDFLGHSLNEKGELIRSVAAKEKWDQTLAEGKPMGNLRAHYAHCADIEERTGCG